jgi:hypothetical protein
MERKQRDLVTNNYDDDEKQEDVEDVMDQLILAYVKKRRSEIRDEARKKYLAIPPPEREDYKTTLDENLSKTRHVATLANPPFNMFLTARPMDAGGFQQRLIASNAESTLIAEYTHTHTHTHAHTRTHTHTHTHKGNARKWVPA